MIKPTAEDIGRKVRLATIPNMAGVLRNLTGCGNCGVPCVGIEYSGRGVTIATHPKFLQWADESLL